MEPAGTSPALAVSLNLDQQDIFLIFQPTGQSVILYFTSKSDKIAASPSEFDE